MGAIKAAIGDVVLTFMWVFSASTLGLLTTLIVDAVGFPGHQQLWPSLCITTGLIFVFVTVFTVIGDALGGASFNPTGTASFYAAGVGSDTLFSLALRFPAQALGAVGGAMAIMEVMPSQYKHMIGGPALKVDLHTGAIVEGVLTFLITFLVLVILLRGPRSSFLKTLLLAIVTVALVVAGSVYTGPSMNPANACFPVGLFLRDRMGYKDVSRPVYLSVDGTAEIKIPGAYGWAYVNNRHNTWEQFYVYWICPFIGAILAAWVFRALFPPPAKQKTA